PAWWRPARPPPRTAPPPPRPPGGAGAAQPCHLPADPHGPLTAALLPDNAYPTTNSPDDGAPGGARPAVRPGPGRENGPGHRPKGRPPPSGHPTLPPGTARSLLPDSPPPRWPPF